MSKEDTAAGLLSKVVRFVKNPATNWSDLDGREAGREEELSKQLLKEMIERKRRNDFVRKREFDMLRKMRKREAMVGQEDPGRPSFFHSSMPSRPDDRASTLKKIDEIEAQMSMQWWKTKNAGASGLSSVGGPGSTGGGPTESTHTPLLNNALPASYASTKPMGLQSEETTAPAPPPFSAHPTAPLPLRSIVGPDESPIAGRVGSAASQPPPRPAAAPTPAAPPVSASGSSAPPVPTKAAAPAASDSGGSGYTGSKFNVDVAEVVHDPELEEASIRFANGDDAGAEAGLLEVLGPQGSRGRHAETWLTLFDLYRATGQHDKFEVAALDFVQRFDRSAPQWFSMPELVKVLSTPAGKPSANANGPAADWVCPSAVGIQTVATLKAALVKAHMPWRLDWSNLKSIDPAAVEPLSKVFSDWSSQPVQLRFISEAQLHQVLQNAAPSGQREVTQDWWHLRMEALRVTHKADDFELTALDFCVTYEVSPPAWSSALCEYRPMQKGGDAAGQAIIGDVYRDSSISSSLSALDGDTVLDGPSSQLNSVLSVELSGQIEGDAIDVLDKIEAKMTGADVMLISCAKLIRVDFSAAGTLLNWVSAREAEHRAVQFSDVNRLVAAFFNVIGITEHARVLTRVD